MIDVSKRVQAQRLTAKQVAERYGFTQQSLANWRMQRRGPRFYRIGRSIRYDVADVEAFMSAGLVETAGARAAV